MTSVAVVLFLAVHAAGVYVAFSIWKEIEKIRIHLEQSRKPSPGLPPTATGGTVTNTHQFPPLAVYAIWIYQGRCWELDLKSVPPGYAAGNPPAFAGSFEGQRVKKECGRC